MDRRRYLTGIAVSVTALSGCPLLQPADDDSGSDATPTEQTPTAIPTSEPTTSRTQTRTQSQSRTTVEGTETTGPTTDGTTTDSGDQLDPSNVERLVHEAVNAAREEFGLSPLTYDQALASIARSHSQDMVERNYFSHESPDGQTAWDRYEEAGYFCDTELSGSQEVLGGPESILRTFYQQQITTDDGLVIYETPTQLADGIVQQWLNSDDYRQNIIDGEFEREGIGIVVEREGDIRVTVTQNLC